MVCKTQIQRMTLSVTLLVALMTLVTLSGCATTLGGKKPAHYQEQPANEALLKAADNQAGLIELYKGQLVKAKNENEAKNARLKLGRAYLATNDPESTLFVIDAIADKSQKDASIWLLKSRALLALGKPKEALEAATLAETISKDNPDIFNQLGVVYADMGNLKQAREFFNKARATMLDDLIVKNNLAMLDILEKDYASAIKRLMPLYTSGQADERIKANLVVALVRAGLYNEFKSVYAGAKSEQERISLFMALSSAQPEMATSQIVKK